MQLSTLPLTSIVGSYPLVTRLTLRGQELLSQLQAEGRVELCSFFDYLVAHAVIDQLVITSPGAAHEGLDVIGTGQPSLSLADNMCRPFYAMFSGMTAYGNHSAAITYRTGEIRFDEERARATGSPWRECQLAHEIVSWYNEVFNSEKRLKANVTGPVTLFCGIPEAPDAAGERVAEFKAAVLEYTKSLKQAGYLDLVQELQIDEPVLTESNLLRVHVVGIPLVRELVESIADIGIRVSLHTCGEVDEDRLSMLDTPKLSAYDLEFANLLGNDSSSIYKRGYLAQLREIVATSKVRNWSFGVVASSSHRIEPSEVVGARVRLLSLIVPVDRLTVKPDCGLRGLDLEEARGKLSRVVEAGEVLRRLRSEQRRRILFDVQQRLGEIELRSKDGPAAFGAMATVAATRDEDRNLAKLMDKFELWLQFLQNGDFAYFTVHGAAHSRSVLHYVSQFLHVLDVPPAELRHLFLAGYGHDIGLFASEDGPLFSQEESRRLGALLTEVYGAEAAWFVRDSGFAEGRLRGPLAERRWEIVRKSHGLRSALMFRAECKDELGLSDHDVTVFEEVVRAHQSSAVLPRHEVSEEGVRMRFLAALVRMADECDISRHRLPPATTRERVHELAIGSDERRAASARVSEREYRKMTLVEHVIVDHYDHEIVLFSSAEQPDDLALVAEVAMKVGKNLLESGCREALRTAGIRVDRVRTEPWRAA